MVFFMTIHDSTGPVEPEACCQGRAADFDVQRAVDAMIGNGLLPLDEHGVLQPEAKNLPLQGVEAPFA